MEEKVAALEALVKDLQGRVQVLEVMLNRSSLDRIQYVKYEQPIWVDTSKLDIPYPSKTEGLGLK